MLLVLVVLDVAVDSGLVLKDLPVLLMKDVNGLMLLSVDITLSDSSLLNVAISNEK